MNNPSQKAQVGVRFVSQKEVNSASFNLEIKRTSNVESHINSLVYGELLNFS